MRRTTFQVGSEWTWTFKNFFICHLLLRMVHLGGKLVWIKKKNIISQDTINLNRCLITSKHIPNKFITSIRLSFKCVNSALRIQSSTLQMSIKWGTSSMPSFQSKQVPVMVLSHVLSFLSSGSVLEWALTLVLRRGCCKIKKKNQTNKKQKQFFAQ